MMTTMPNGERKTWEDPLDKKTARYLKKNQLRIVRHDNERSMCGVEVWQRLLFQLEPSTAKTLVLAKEGSLMSRLLGAMRTDAETMSPDVVRMPSLDPIGFMVAEGIVGGMDVRQPGSFLGQCPKMILCAAFDSFSRGMLKGICVFDQHDKSWKEIKASFKKTPVTSIFLANLFSFHDHLEELAAVDCKVAVVLKLKCGGARFHGNVLLHLPGEDKWLIQDNQHLWLTDSSSIAKQGAISKIAQAKGAEVIAVGFFPTVAPVEAIPIANNRPSRRAVKEGQSTNPKEFKPCADCLVCGGLNAFEALEEEKDASPDSEDDYKPLLIQRVHGVSSKEEGPHRRILEGYDRAGTVTRAWTVEEESEGIWRCMGSMCGNTGPFPSDPKLMAEDDLLVFMERRHHLYGCWKRLRRGRPTKKKTRAPA